MAKRDGLDAAIGCAIAALVGLLLSVAFAGCYGCSKVRVSDGYRDGTVRKVSNTGLVWKTWEVETVGDGMRMVNGRLTPETFVYSVSSPAVVEELSRIPPTKRVRLHYQRHLTAWQPNGETPVFITRVEVLP